MATQNAQSEALANLLQTGDYSDLTITCGKDQYRVHKAIICPRSNFFKAACDGKFKEAQTGEIDLPDDDPTAVRMMIQYLYHDTYVPPKAIIHRDHNGTIDAHLSETEYNDEQKRKMELYGATFVGNKRVKRLTAPPEVPITPISQPVPVGSGTASTPPPPPSAASQEPGRGRGRSRRGRGSFGGVNSPSGYNAVQASPDQSSPTPNSFLFGSSSPAPTPPPPPQPSAPPRPIYTPNLHLHAKVYTLGEKYGIQPLKALALRKFETEAPFRLHTDDFLEAIREAYTSTIETDRPLRDAVVAILRNNKHLLKKDSVKAVLKDPGLGLSFDMVMQFASD
ncbi:amino acid transport gap1 [Fusarium tjaetaba]|uniref:Amino acid transport gap1 n=1 Tax=Fusarium tjaetaba TaxID=1567544 RepID=A0A8H5RDA5_9HYPO|nr:amino acid transport gap1 [Fusarium tjaetaba]KAF5631134.1 amino acid transport gap1 [Fusarium tjaetaba]